MAPIKASGPPRHSGPSPSLLVHVACLLQLVLHEVEGLVAKHKLVAHGVALDVAHARPRRRLDLAVHRPVALGRRGAFEQLICTSSPARWGAL